ncbi:peptide deformylase 1B, chloroplastic-like [Zingiber officinale]|uniref:peptide deformylase 1B, chloroplastic-like n=1 Tax=Zingiber officinale TaxID=94328 RepID=UPI001C4C959A|nr:peptide deformylase 1B, chloroplastic-like [Zingiber officinale]
MAARLSASPALSYAALVSRRAAASCFPRPFPFPCSGAALRGFSSQPLAVVRDSPFADVSVQARRGPSSQVGDFASPADLCFESPLKIVEYPDPILRARNKRISAFDENLRKLVDEMFDIMYKTDGVGLSAPQVGVNVQLMVFNPAGERGEGEEIVLVNPKMYKASTRTFFYNEGCLSFPGIYADVERPASIKVDARDINGARFRVNLSGLPARIFQHEFDHLQGILFFDRMTEDILETIRSQLKLLEKKYENTTGLESPESIDKNISGQRKEIAGFAQRKEITGFARR